MKARVLLGSAVLAVVAMTATGTQVPSALAAASPPPAGGGQPSAPAATPKPPNPNVRSTALSSWQTDATVWTVAYAGGVVYAGGQFGSVRPAGEAAGSTAGSVSRTFLAAFSASTGALITSFDPVITGASDAGVYALAASPDGKTLYAGGVFSHVNGLYRDNLAAFSTVTGKLTGWNPSAYGKVNAITPAGSVVYLGGSFNQVSGYARTYAAAVTTAGSLLPWAPLLDNAVTTIAVHDAQVLIGGYFTSLNGAAENAAGAVDSVRGTQNYPWAANIVPATGACDPPAVKDIVISGNSAYLGSEGTGSGCFDGDFAVHLGNVSKGGSDTLLWQNDCLGATQSLVVIHGYLFKGSHAHDCAYAPGGFPQVPNPAGDWITHRLLDQSLSSGRLEHWNPNTDATLLGPRTMATDGSALFLGGDFTKVNGKPQQGIAIFPAGPEKARPPAPAKPVVTSTTGGVASISFPAVSTPQFGKLTYTIYRTGVTQAVGQVSATSWPWALPVVRYRLTGLKPGSSASFTVTASDGFATSVRSPVSVPVAVAAVAPAMDYQNTVLHASPALYWLLDQASGHVAQDASPNRADGVYEPGTTLGVAGPITGSQETAVGFDGKSGIVTSATSSTSPQTFSIEAWFKTSTDTGGEIAGFGNKQTGTSTQYDRQLYLMNDGQLVFGVQAGGKETIETPDVYNDGRWHYVVATFSSAGGPGNMALYVDGQLIGTQATTSAAQAYTGYWRFGGGNLGGWNLDFWGSNSQGTTEPNSYYFRGSIGDAAIYPYALTALEVAQHYAANALEH